MKKIFTLVLFASLIMSCSKESEAVIVEKNTTTTVEDSRRLDPTAENCYTEVNLIAGQNYIAGIVSYQVVNNENLIVTYTTTNGWEIGATHLYVGACNEIPTNQPGNPRIGQFPYKSTESAGTTEVIWTIPVTDFPDCGCIAAHAEVANGSQQETAWAEGEQLPGESWAMFFDYCVSDCL